MNPTNTYLVLWFTAGFIRLLLTVDPYSFVKIANKVNKQCNNSYFISIMSFFFKEGGKPHFALLCPSSQTIDPCEDVN